MKKKVTCILMMVAMVLSVCTVHADDALNLSGYWTTEANDGTRMVALIEDDEVAIVWDIDDEQYIYWVGSYIAPEEDTDEYTWTSVRDAEQTDTALFASTDDTKDFHYNDGEISIEASAFGSSGTVYFYPTDAESIATLEADPDSGVSEEASDSDANNDFEEQTLVDNDECTVIATGLEADDYGGYVLNLYLENKSDDVNYTFAVRNGAVNGLDGYGYLDEMLDPGESREEYIEFDSLSDFGITNVTDINLDLRVYDSDDWSAEVANEDIHIYPLGEDNIVMYERESQDSDIVLADNDYATIIATGYEGDASSDYQIDVFLINKTNETVWFTAEDASINGCKMNPNFSYTITAGNCAYGKIRWRADDLEENNISEVSEIEMTLKVYADDEYSGDGFLNETVTLNP